MALYLLTILEGAPRQLRAAGHAEIAVAVERVIELLEAKE